MVGVWIEPVTAHVMMTLPCAAAIVGCLAEKNARSSHEPGNSRRIAGGCGTHGQGAGAVNLRIRRAEPADYKAACELHAQPNALRGTLQLPFPSEEKWKERLAKHGDNDYGLVACVEGEIVGMAFLHAAAYSPRRAHVGHLGMAVHDKLFGKGAGTALMRPAIELADKC